MDKLTAKDFASDQDIRWCPGCGDFAILKQMQMVLAKEGADPNKTVFISGIGCSSRFPYYMNTYGMHSIHGRAPAFATGLALTRPDLDIWIITGDGDALSIGGNHLIHLLRRDVNVNLLLFNNEIYGLTKGQYSPTSKQNIITKSSPTGSKDKPFNPLALAFGAGATFIARSIDREAKHLQEILIEAKKHVGTSFVEVYQNCHIFNDGAFEEYTNKQAQKSNAIFLEHGKPILFGESNEFGIILDSFTPKIVLVADIDESLLWVHDNHDKVKASILINFIENGREFPKLFGIVYQEIKEEKNIKEWVIYKSVDKEKMNKIIKGQSHWDVK